MSGIGDALSGGLQHLQDLLDQALGGPPPQPDAQPDDQPGANDTPTPPPPDLQDWGDDQAPPAPPDTSPPAEPPPAQDPYFNPGDQQGFPPQDPYFNPGDQQGGPPDIGPPAPPDIGPPAPTDLGGGGGSGGGGIGSDAAASGGAGEYTLPTSWSDYLGNALTGFGNLLVPPAGAATMELPPITMSPDETPPVETDRLGPTSEGTAAESQGTGGPNAPQQDQFFNPSDQWFPDQTPSDQPTTGSLPDWAQNIPMPPGVNDLVSNPPTAGDYGGYGAGAAAAAAAAGLIGAGVGGIGGGGGTSDSGSAGFGPWSASPGGGVTGGGGTAGDTGNIMSDVNPSEFVAPGTKTAQAQAQALPPGATRPPAPIPQSNPLPQYPQIPPERYNYPPQQVAPAHQRDLDYLSSWGGHNTEMPMLNPHEGTPSPLTQQSPNFEVLNHEFAARLAAAGRAYQQQTGNEPFYGEASRGVAVQNHYWEQSQHGRLYPASPPYGRSSHENGRAMDIPGTAFRNWLYQHGNDYGLSFLPGDRPHIRMQPGYTGNNFYGNSVPNTAQGPGTPSMYREGGTLYRAPVPAPPTGYQYGGQRPMVPQDPSLTEPYGPPAPPPAPTAQERQDAAALARANQEAIRRGLMNPDGTPGPNVLRTPQARPEGAPTTDRYFNPSDFAGVPPTPLPQPRPAGAPSVPYSGGGIGSDAARAPDQGQARDQYFNPGDYQGGPYPSTANDLAAEASQQAQRNLENYQDRYFNPGDFQGPYPSTADAAANNLAAEAARRAREALESGQAPTGYDYGPNRPMMPQEPPNYPTGYDYGPNRPMTPPPGLTDPDLTGMQPQPQYVPNRPYDPSMDRPLPGNPYTDPQSMGYDYGPNRPPYPWTRTETSDGTVVDPRKLVAPSEATEAAKVPTPPPPKPKPSPAPTPPPRTAPRYAPAPRPAPRTDYSTGSDIRYFVPGQGIVSQFGAGIGIYNGPDTYSNIQRVYPPYPPPLVYRRRR